MVDNYTDETILDFGKFNGYKLKVIPASYLINLLDKDLAYGKLKIYILENEDFLRMEKKQGILNKA